MTPSAIHHALLRPCILQILRAAGYHATRPSVLDTLTDLAARYLILLAQSTVHHSSLNESDPEVTIQDVRMAMQDLGAFKPEKTELDQEFEGKEDTRGVDNFLAWVTGHGNKQIRNIAMDGGEGAKEDYLTVLKKKHSAGDDDTRYDGTILGKPAVGLREVKVEGAEFTSLEEWTKRRRTESKSPSVISSRRETSELSSLPETPMPDTPGAA